jgi:hypothetical protein
MKKYKITYRSDDIYKEIIVEAVDKSKAIEKAWELLSTSIYIQSIKEV